jgi:hypothetical protein
LREADVVVGDVIGRVCAYGPPAVVVKFLIAPSAVPSPLDAIVWNQYVVRFAKPETAAVTEAPDAFAARVPSAARGITLQELSPSALSARTVLVSLRQNVTVVESPLDVPVPFKVAVVSLTFVASTVVVVGGSAVVNE